MAVVNRIYCDRCNMDLSDRTDFFKLTQKYIKLNKDGTKTYPTIKTLDLCPACYKLFEKFIERK